MAKKKGKKKTKKSKKVSNGKNKVNENLEKSENKDDFDNIGKNQKEKENRILIWFFIIVLLVFGVFLGSYFYVQEAKILEASGIEFVKEDHNDLELYHARFPVFYNARANYNLYLRENPEKNDVPIDIEEWGFYRDVIISTSPEAFKCGKSMVSSSNLAMFLGQAAGRKTKGAVNDLDASNESGLEFANCSNAVNETTVIMIEKSDTPRIYQSEDNEDCYIIEIGECENIKATEKFILGVIAEVNEVEI